MALDPLTPNIKLDLIPPTSPNWAGKMNNNLKLIDAIIGSYFAVNQLKGIWANSTVYIVGDAVVDPQSGVVYKCLIANTSLPAPATFLDNRNLDPPYWGGYASPARNRGPWIPNTSYTANDFVVSGAKYAICIQNNISTGSFDADVISGFWSVLIDLSTVGGSVLPVPGGAADSNKFATVNGGGTGYTIISVAQALQNLGGTSTGLAVFTAITQAAALTAIGAQVAGSYQGHSAALDILAGITAGAYGEMLLTMNSTADLISSLGLLSAAFLNTGVGANNVVKLDGTAKLPVVDGSQLVNTYVPGISAGRNALAGDVALNDITKFFDGPTLNVGGVGRWYVIATLTVVDTSVAGIFVGRLWDGTTLIDSGLITTFAANGQGIITLAGWIDSPVGNLTASVKCTSSAFGKMQFNASGLAKDCILSAFKIL